MIESLWLNIKIPIVQLIPSIFAMIFDSIEPQIWAICIHLEIQNIFK